MIESIVTWKWKSKQGYRSQFGPETVNILRQMVKRNYNKPHRFICVTDDPRGIDSDIEIVPLWDEWGDIPNPHGQLNPSCYRRLKIFSPEAKSMFGERFVSMDLDTVILGDMSPIWDRPEDIVLWGDTSPGTFYNGSMVMMTAGCRPDVWNDFDPIKSPMLAKAAGQFGSDQGVISHKLGPNEAKWSRLDGVYSFRIHVRNRRNVQPPDGARIVMFHGHIDPWSPATQKLDWVRNNWRYDSEAKEGIEAINLVSKTALMTTGKVLPIVHLYDDDGDETDSIRDATSFVCGKHSEWWSGLVYHYRHVLPT